MLLRMHFNANIRPVMKDPQDEAYRCVLLAEGTPSDLSTLTDAQRKTIESAGGAAVPYTLNLGYEHMTTDEVFRTLIPQQGQHDLPSSFEIAGHVAHTNLREEYLAWKFVIGQVLLDKNPALRTVVNKTGVIHETFRTFPMEVLAGSGDTDVEVRHCGAIFRFDFAKVYWNSRLAFEHDLLVTKVIPPGSVVADMMCGVGPFAIPLALAPRLCTVHANDLNPASYAALVENVRRNRVGGRVTTYNLDGRAFIARMVASRVPFAHVVMNLPADAIEFCDAFAGLYAGVGLAGDVAQEGQGAAGGAPSSSAAAPALPTVVAMPLPRIHVYCFVKSPDSYEAAQALAASRLMRALLPHGAAHPADGSSPEALATAQALIPDLSFRHVRDVSPRKMMLCVSFTLPRSVATGPAKVEHLGAGEQPSEAAEPAEGTASNLTARSASEAGAQGTSEPAAKRQRNE